VLSAALLRVKQAKDPRLGQVLDQRFELASVIETRSLGRLYRALELATGREVAVQILGPEAARNASVVARFHRVTPVLCALRSEHTCSTFAAGQALDGSLYLAMELLDGRSLRQLLHEEAPLRWRRVRKILGEVCAAVAEAHGHGLVHGILTPERVLLVRRGQDPDFVKLLDTGLVRVIHGEPRAPPSPRRRLDGVPVGVEYWPPEQVGHAPRDGRSDVYALGALGYEMLTGKVPFGDATGIGSQFAAHLRPPPPPSQRAPDAAIPRAADQLILRCLAKDPHERYADAAQVATALAEAAAVMAPR
jgi:serine/threonine-protein kinase